MSKNGTEPGGSAIVSLRPVWTVKERDRILLQKKIAAIC